MKKFISYIICLILPLVFGVDLRAQFVPSDQGSWNGGTLQESCEITLTGNVFIKSPVIIPSGVTLTLKSDAKDRVIRQHAQNTIGQNQSLNCLFYVQEGGTLILKGEGVNKSFSLRGNIDKTPGDLPVYTKEMGSDEWTSQLDAVVNYKPNDVTYPNCHDFVNGGLIYAVGNVQMTYTSVKNAYSTGKGAAIYRPASTAENQYEFGTISIGVGCEIRNCVAQKGAAIYVGSQANGNNTAESAKITITDGAKVFNNSATSADNVSGVICVESGAVGNVVVGNSSVYNNHSQGRGGAININGGSLIVNNSTFYQNTGKGQGGAIYATVSVSVTDSNIYENCSDKAGGAIKTSSSLTLSGTTLSGNISATRGGAIYLDGGSLTITGESQIFDNQATTSGGAIDAAVTVTITNSSVYLNKSEGKGGAFYMNGGSLTITGESQIYDNQATNQGGAFYMYGGSLTITGESQIYDNQATNQGGAIYSDASSIDINNSSVCRNRSNTKGGGAINVQKAGSLSISEAEITDNQSYTNGGAIFYAGEGEFAIANATLSDNVCGSSGGAIWISGGYMNMSHTLIEKSNSGGYGGAIVVSSDSQNTTTITECTIKNNESLSYGGGLLIVKGDVVVTESEISSNKATNGAGVYIGGTGTQASLNLSSTKITGNQALYNGVDVFTTAYNVSTTDANISGVGGGIYVNKNSSVTLGQGIALYDNLADKLADDIFSTSASSTQITIPDVSKMDLSEYVAPASYKLGFIEDYMDGDTGYSRGTNVNTNYDYVPGRYRDAIASRTDTYALDVPNNGLQLTDKYLALAFGYDKLYVTLVRKGLLKGENALYDIYYFDDKSTATTSDDEWVCYTRVALRGPADAVDDSSSSNKSVSKRVSLFSGEWMIKENAWAWSYNIRNATSLRTLNGSSSQVDKVFLIVGSKKLVEEDYVEADKYTESSVTHDFGSDETVLDKSSEESSSSFENITTNNGVSW